MGCGTAGVVPVGKPKMYLSLLPLPPPLWLPPVPIATLLPAVESGPF